MTVTSPGPTKTAAQLRPVHPDRVGHRPEATAPRAPMTAEPTIGAALIERAGREPDAVAYYVLEAGTIDSAVRLTVQELLERAGAAAAALADYGVRRGDRVGICLDTSVDLLAAVYGCALLGAAPFICEPPLVTMKRDRWAARLEVMLEIAEPTAFIAGPAFLPAVTEPCKDADVPLVAADFTPDYGFPASRAEPDDIAVIQFTSGTTGDPKGVTLTHRQMLANCGQIGDRIGYRTDDTGVSWLPLYHDMGLIGAALSPFMHGIPVALTPPLSFALRPERWLEAMHHFRGTMTSAPNFAYHLCATRLSDAALEGLDLSSCRMAGNGAEFIDARTLHAWNQRMRHYGIRTTTSTPCYGMAEIGLAATMCPVGEEPRVLTVVRDVLSETGEVVLTGADDPRGQQMVSAGPPMAEVEVRIVGEDGGTLPEYVQGEVQLRTPSLMLGYYRRPEATARTVVDGWLHTGDTGFIADGELYPTGRTKDLIILAGRNHHPYPFEQAAASVAGVRPESVAAVGLRDQVQGTELLAIALESRTARDAEAAADLARQVTTAVHAETGTRPELVRIVPRGTLPKTPSGKLQRKRIATMLTEQTAAEACGEARTETEG